MTKIIFFGTPDFVIPVLKTLIENFDVVGIVTAPDQKAGRKQILTPSPVKVFAKSVMLNSFQHLDKIPKQVRDDIVILTPEKLDADFSNKLQALSPELFVVAAYGKIIPQNILEIPKFGAINIHPSLLPKYRGPSPIQSAILNGDETSGISIIKMDEKMDHGPLVYTEDFRLTSLDNFQTLSTKMFLRSAEILTKIIPEYVAGKIEPVEQNETLASYCKIIKKEDGYFELPINSNDSPNFLEKIDRMIRAYYPWPTAWTRWNGKIIKFIPSFSCHSELAPLRSSQYPWGVSESKQTLNQVQGGKFPQNDKYLVQMEGKNPVKLEEFLRGYPDFPIKVLLEHSKLTA